MRGWSFWAWIIPTSKEPGNEAVSSGKNNSRVTRATLPRVYRNTLVFLAADKTRLQELDEAVRRKYLAWESILDERVQLDLGPHQIKQAEMQKAAADGTVTARLPETYQWLLVPVQASPQAAIEWQAHKLSGQDALAVRVSKKLRNDELLLTGFASTRLRMELDRVPLWRGNHVAVKQLAEDFARYLYLPRLKDPMVLTGAIRDGMALLTGQRESFAFADAFDEEKSRYRGLRGGPGVSLVDADSPGLLVKGEVARAQLDAASAHTSVAGAPGGSAMGGVAAALAGAAQAGPLGSSAGRKSVAAAPKRFHGTVSLHADRVGRDASRVAEEVIAHLTGLVGANVRITLAIEAELPSGAPEPVVRTVTENSRTLKFTSHGFEKE